MAVIENFFGKDFAGTDGTNPNAQAAVILKQTYDELSERLYSVLMVQTHLKDIYSLVTYTWDDTKKSFVGDLTAARGAIQAKINENRDAGIATLSEFARVIKGYKIEDGVGFSDFRKYFADQSEDYAVAIDLTGASAIVGGTSNDSLSGTSNNDNMGGGDGDDNIYGNAGNDLVYGQKGNDNLYGGYGNDTLDGGAGNDYLEGDYGNDTYMFGRGSGQDTVYDNDSTAGNVDTIQMAADVLPADVTIKRSSYDLVLSINGTGDTLTVNNWFYNDNLPQSI